MTLAYISNGRLSLCADSGSFRELRSPFIDQVVYQHQQSARRHGWKSESAGDGMMDYNLWNRTGEDAGAAHPARVTSVAQAPDQNRLFYFLL